MRREELLNLFERAIVDREAALNAGRDPRDRGPIRPRDAAEAAIIALENQPVELVNE